MWKLSIISTLLSGALFFGIGLEVGKRWQRAEDTQRARDQLDAALVRAEEQVAELNQKWADAVAAAEDRLACIKTPEPDRKIYRLFALVNPSNTCLRLG